MVVKMQNDGELKNRIRDLMLNDEFDEKWLIQTVDEAKKEFPVDFEKSKTDTRNLKEWFIKWFVNSPEKEENGTR
jgi:hypothetical protein